MVKKEQVIKYLEKSGFNKDNVIKMVEDNFDFAVNCYPHAKTAKISEIVSTVY